MVEQLFLPEEYKNQTLKNGYLTSKTSSLMFSTRRVQTYKYRLKNFEYIKTVQQLDIFYMEKKKHTIQTLKNICLNMLKIKTIWFNDVFHLECTNTQKQTLKELYSNTLSSIVASQYPTLDSKHEIHTFKNIYLKKIKI